jgi:hypothetical protein
MVYNFKNGDIVKIKWLDRDRICILDKIVEKNGETRVYIYTEMTLEDEELCFAPECKISYNIDTIELSMASDDEKRSLYNALYKDYTEIHQPDWLIYFTDSTYFEILDYVLYMFGIPEVDDDGDCPEYPEFMYEIRNYIWDECEKVADALGGCTPKSSDDKVSLSEVCEWLNGTIDEGVMVKCGSVIKFHSKEEFVEMLRLKFSKDNDKTC